MRSPLIPIAAAVGLALLAGAGSIGAQETRPLTLGEALNEVLEGNAALEAARLQTEEARARARGASAFLWPAIGLDAGVVRSDDPVAVFGTRLRQGRFSQADFELESLNHPEAVTDWTVAAGVSWTVLDPVGWSAREAALRGAEAVGRGADRTREAVIFRTKVLYLEAVRAQGRVAASEEALAAAEATAERMTRRRDEGVLTDAAVLQAQAELEAARAGLAEALRAEVSARRDLGVHLGWPAEELPVPVDAVGLLQAPGDSVGEGLGVERRSDLESLKAQVERARAEESGAFRSRLPAVEGFARLSTHAPEIAGQREENWTVGVRVNVPLFTGFGLEARRDAAGARRRSAETRLEQARREARAELEDAVGAVESARNALTASESAARAAREGRRLVARRFEEGMATPAELLQAEARSARMQSRVVDARAAYGIALARLEFVAASGTRDTEFNPSRIR